ncbi:hypothetical protein AN641_09535 [Candidatus Epulonipiscioides gigas]|nr:hypothetical protein AN641_09535 [Epulopiscium sp. SCG-C07WGA-EpuloA2]
MSNNIASGKLIELITPVTSVEFTDANALGVLTTPTLKFVMPEGNVDILKDLQFKFSATDVPIPAPTAQSTGTGFSLLNINAPKKEGQPSFLALKSSEYASVLEGKLITSKGTLPSSMTINLLSNGQNILPESKIPAGTTVSMQLQMFSSYSIQGGTGNTNLEITVSSPTGLKLLNATHTQIFVDAQTIGALNVLTFDFVMPEHNIDFSKDFKFGFALK